MTARRVERGREERGEREKVRKAREERSGKQHRNTRKQTEYVCLHYKSPSSH